MTDKSREARIVTTKSGGQLVLIMILTFGIFFVPRAAFCADGLYTGGATPSDVYVEADLLNRYVDALIEKTQLGEAPIPPNFGQDIRPTHVYFLARDILQQAIFLENSSGGRALPYKVPIVAKNYQPADVKALLVKSIGLVENIAETKGINLKDIKPGTATGKEPKDVYGVLIQVWGKLIFLEGRRTIKPSNVFELAKVIRQEADLISLALVNNFYDIHVKGDSSIKPANVFEKALEIRLILNRLRERFNLSPLSAPKVPDNYVIQPRDVYLQCLLLLAEFNLLKVQLGLAHPIPLTSPARGKRPKDVWAELETAKQTLEKVLDKKLAS